VSKTNVFIVACGVLVLACGTAASGTPAEHLGTRAQALSEARHQYVTRPAVEAWVNPDTAAALAAVSTIGDDDPVASPHSETHFDNCYWEEGRDFVLAKRQEAASAAVAFASSGSAEDQRACFDSLGFVFHAVQDHYAHSNWVETHEPGELAPLDVPDEPPPPDWISGVVTNDGDTGSNAGPLHCPPGTPGHEELNKDETGSLEADEAFLDATLATTDQLIKFIEAVQEAAPADAERVLAELGFSEAPATTTTRDDEVEALPSETGPFGLETPAVYCAPGSYVTGFSQRVEADQGDDDDEDDTGLNAVALYCADKSESASQRLSAWEGMWGEWSEPQHCPGGALAMEAQIKLEDPQGLDDAQAATAVRFGCSDGTALQAANDSAAGAWRGPFACPAKSAFCGLSLWYQPPQDDGDDTALNGIRLRCCSAPGLTGDGGGLDAITPKPSTAPEASGCSLGRAVASPTRSARSPWLFAWCCAACWYLAARARARSRHESQRSACGCGGQRERLDRLRSARAIPAVGLGAVQSQIGAPQ
jgi:hypothetical protein